MFILQWKRLSANFVAPNLSSRRIWISTCEINMRSILMISLWMSGIIVNQEKDFIVICALPTTNIEKIFKATRSRPTKLHQWSLMKDLNVTSVGYLTKTRRAWTNTNAISMQKVHSIATFVGNCLIKRTTAWNTKGITRKGRRVEQFFFVMTWFRK